MQYEQNFFDKLLSQPEEYRKKVAYGLTGIISLFIFAAWMLVATEQVKQAQQPVPVEETKTAQDSLREKMPSLQKEETLKTQLMQDQENPDDEPGEPTPRKPVIQR